MSATGIPSIITFTETLARRPRAAFAPASTPSVNRCGLLSDDMDTITTTFPVRDLKSRYIRAIHAIGGHSGIERYWRGGSLVSASTQPTLQDLLKPNLYLELTYPNPHRWSGSCDLPPVEQQSQHHRRGYSGRDP